MFFLIRMDSPDVREAIQSSIVARSSGDWLYQRFNHGMLAGALGRIGALRWRVGMIVAVLAILFVPLRTSLVQVRDELASRDATQDAIRSLVSRSGLVSSNLDIGARVIELSLVVTESLPREKVLAAERAIVRRTGKEARIIVRQVASQQDLALLRERLKAPVEARPADLEAVRREIAGRLGGAMMELWPAEAGTLEDYELAFGRTGITTRIRYRGAQPLDEKAGAFVRSFLRSRLSAENLETRFEFVPEKPAALRAAPGR